MTAPDRLFISHSSGDKNLVDKLVDLILMGVGVTHEKIFCTSLEGMGIPEGEDFKALIHTQLQNPPLVIMVITPSYYESPFCLCELGASWAMSHSSFPLLVPPINFRDLRAVLVNSQARLITDPSGLDALRDRVIDRLDLKSPAPTARWNVKRDEFLRELPDILERIQRFTRVPADRLEEVQAQYEAAQEMLAERHREVDAQKDLVQRLMNLKDRAEASKLLAEKSGELETFEMLVKTTVAAIDPLPAVVVEALFYDYYGEDYWPTADDSWKWDPINRAIEDGYLVSRDSFRKTVDPNKDDRTILKAIGALEEIKGFLEDESTSEEFYDHYETKHGFPADIRNRRFWKGALGMSGQL